MSEVKEKEPSLRELDAIVIRFAGDSGDGMQLTGTQFTNTSAVLGNDISTFPDFPAEIRARGLLRLPDVHGEGEVAVAAEGWKGARERARCTGHAKRETRGVLWVGVHRNRARSPVPETTHTESRGPHRR